MSNDDLADLIQQNYGFSDARSENIARTETAFADSAGNMAAYRASGVVSGKRWITGAGCCDLCEALDGMRCRLMLISRTAATARRCIRNAGAPVRASAGRGKF